MPLLALFFIAAVALVVVRIGATALMMTGLSRDVADFQAVSCFFGVGFTTSEAEMIVSHPVRRKIATHLIITGNIGLTGALSTLILTFVSPEQDWLDHLIELVFGTSQGSVFFVKILLILAVIVLISLMFRLRPVRVLLEWIIRYSLERASVVRAMDYDTLLRARDGYVVSQFEVDPGHPHIGKSLGDIGLGSRGVLVIGIYREGGPYIGAPRRTTLIQAGDILTVYGEDSVLRHELIEAQSHNA